MTTRFHVLAVIYCLFSFSALASDDDLPKLAESISKFITRNNKNATLTLPSDNCPHCPTASIRTNFFFPSPYPLPRTPMHVSFERWCKSRGGIIHDRSFTAEQHNFRDAYELYRPTHKPYSLTTTLCVNRRDIVAILGWQHPNSVRDGESTLDFYDVTRTKALVDFVASHREELTNQMVVGRNEAAAELKQKTDAEVARKKNLLSTYKVGQVVVLSGLDGRKGRIAKLILPDKVDVEVAGMYETDVYGVTRPGHLVLEVDRIKPAQ